MESTGVIVKGGVSESDNNNNDSGREFREDSQQGVKEITAVKEVVHSGRSKNKKNRKKAQNVKTEEVQKIVKPEEVQQIVKPDKVQKIVKPDEVQKIVKPEEVQKISVVESCVKSLEEMKINEGQDDSKRKENVIEEVPKIETVEERRRPETPVVSAAGLDDGRSDNDRNYKGNLKTNDRRRQRTLYVGNLLSTVKEDMLKNLFAQVGRVVYVKINSGFQGPYAFVEFESEEVAEKAFNTMSGQTCLGRQMNIRWSDQNYHYHVSRNQGRHHQYQYDNRGPTPSKNYHVFVSNLSPKTTGAMLRASFEQFGEVAGARVVTDHSTSECVGHGFVYFTHKPSAERAIGYVNVESNRLKIDERFVRVKWAEYLPPNPMKGERQLNPYYSSNRRYDNHGHYGSGAPVPFGNYNGNNNYIRNVPAPMAEVTTNGGSANAADANLATLYVGNLSTSKNTLETREKLHQRFSEFGNVLNVKVISGKSFAFISFATREEAELALMSTHCTVFEGRSLKIGWGWGRELPGGQKDFENYEESNAPGANGGFGDCADNWGNNYNQHNNNNNQQQDDSYSNYAGFDPAASSSQNHPQNTSDTSNGSNTETEGYASAPEENSANVQNPIQYYQGYPNGMVDNVNNFPTRMDGLIPLPPQSYYPPPEALTMQFNPLNGLWYPPAQAMPNMPMVQIQPQPPQQHQQVVGESAESNGSGASTVEDTTGVNVNGEQQQQQNHQHPQQPQYYQQQQYPAENQTQQEGGTGEVKEFVFEPLPTQAPFGQMWYPFQPGMNSIGIYGENLIPAGPDVNSVGYHYYYHQPQFTPYYNMDTNNNNHNFIGYGYNPPHPAGNLGPAR